MLSPLLLSLAIAAAPTEPGRAQVDRHLRQADRNGERCFQAIADPSPAERQTCYFEASRSYTSVLKRGENVEFKKLLSDLFEPLLLWSTGGYDALAIRVVVASNEAEFARARAAILGGVDAKTNVLKPQAKNPFYWVQDGVDQADFFRRWTFIRDRDCRAYKVPHCRARMDAALHKLIDDTSPSKS